MNVRGIQRALQSLGFDPGPIDGIWACKTIAAVEAFQEANGLPASGIVDPRTEREIPPGPETSRTIRGSSGTRRRSG